MYSTRNIFKIVLCFAIVCVSVQSWQKSGRNLMKHHKSNLSIYTEFSNAVRVTTHKSTTRNRLFDKKDSEENSDIAPEGFLSSDFRTVGDGKQIRVIAYIVLSLIPCLFLVPFFLSRDFVPPSEFPPTN